MHLHHSGHSTILRDMKPWSGIILLIAFLTLVAAPSFCSGGVLAHCCAPDGPHHEADHHEDTCQSDPCNRDALPLLTKRIDDDPPRLQASTPAALPAGSILAGHDVTALFPPAPRQAVPLSRSASALPLLC